MSATFSYSTAIAFTAAEINKLNNLVQRMQKRATNSTTTISVVNNWSITINSVDIWLTYNNSCNMRSSIKGALNKAVGAKRLQ
ncbi:hypothetical protein ACSVC9_02555 [Clostridium sp. LBM24168]